MKKLASLLLSVSLIVLPVVATAQPNVQASDQGVMIAVAKKAPKKVIKKVVKKVKATKVVKTKAPASAAASCTIKGNISSSKEKIFHVLGCPNYGQTVIDTTKGERMFCSEQEAKDAGWRKALNCP